MQIRERMRDSKFVVIVIKGEEIIVDSDGEITVHDRSSLMSALPELFEGKIGERKIFGKEWKQICDDLIVGYSGLMKLPLPVFQSILSDIEEGFFIIDLSTGN